MNETPGKPQFRLARTVPGGSEQPQVFAVGDDGSSGPLDRRQFIRFGAGVPAALALATFWAERAMAADDPFRAHRNPITFLLASSEGAALVSGSTDEVKKWALPGGALQGAFGSGLRGDGAWRLLSGGTRLAHASASGVSTHRFPEGSEIGSRLPIGFSKVTDMAAAGNLLAITDGMEIAFASIASTAPPQLTRKTQGASVPTGLITCLAASDSLFVSGSKDGWILKWNMGTSAFMERFKIGGSIVCMTAIPNQALVAAGNSDGTITLVSLADGNSLTLAKSSASVVALAPGPKTDDEETLIAATEDGDVEVFSLLTGDRLATRRLDLGSPTALAVTAKNSQIVVGSKLGQIALLDWPSLQPAASPFDPAVNQSSVKGLSYQIVDPVTRTTVTYTLPCGSPIPPGAICVCNCVPGTIAAPQPSVPSSSTGRSATQACGTPIPPGKICTCNCIPGG